MQQQDAQQAVVVYQIPISEYNSSWPGEWNQLSVQQTVWCQVSGRFHNEIKLRRKNHIRNRVLLIVFCPP